MLSLTISAWGVCDVIVPRALLDNTGNTFLNKLVVYLEAVSDFSESDLHIELVGKLPVISQRESLDFFLFDDKKGSLDVLYRTAGSPSYRKAAVTVKEVRNNVSQFQGEISATAADALDKIFIRKGTAITIALVSGAIQLDVTGEALESGYGNGRIRVKVSESGKEFEGIIAGPLEVHVEL